MDSQTQTDQLFLVVDSQLDSNLIAAQNGDADAFSAIWKDLNPRIVKFAASQCYGTLLDRDDIASETWASVVKDIGKFKGDYHQFQGWIFTLARNRVIDLARKRDRQVKSGGNVSEIDVQDGSILMEQLFEADETRTSIIKYIQCLPKTQAEIVMMRIIGDLSVAETAQLLSRSENTVRVLCHRGLIALRASLISNEFNTQ